MRESTLRKINYAMIVAILVSLFLHFAFHGFFGFVSYENSLTYADAVGRYRAPITSALLTVLLIAAAFHGLYGLRTILLSFRTGRVWNRAVSYGVLAAGFVLVVWGMRTIVVAGLG